MGVRNKMKVLLVVCFMIITFFSQGWGGKHYLVKTKDEVKHGHEAGYDYNEEYGDYGDGLEAYGDDDTVGDDTYDGDTYDEENNGEEIDVESMIIDEGSSALVEDFEKMPKKLKDDTIEKVNEAAHNVRNSQDYNHNLKALTSLLSTFKFVLEAILELMSNKAYGRHKVKKSVLRCRKDWRRKCITKEKTMHQIEKLDVSKYRSCNSRSKSVCQT